MASKITLDELAELLYEETDYFLMPSDARDVINILNAEGIFDPDQVEDAI